MAPGGLPRLKTVFLYLLAPLGSIAAFTPAQAEGITSVRWFTIREAVQAVTHSSLQPVMASLQSQIDAVEPDCIPTFGAMT